jgi:alkylation response protein AidB-like acyl-CoA dehydrogenase
MAMARTYESEQQFRQALHQALVKYVAHHGRPNTSPSGHEGLDATRHLHGYLFRLRLVGATFPVEYGGLGLTDSYQRIFERELQSFGLPAVPRGVGTCAPTLLAHGTEAQKRRHLAALLSGAETWMQLLSEPGGGSDLAAVSTTATRRGDEFHLSGRKTWSTGAQYADFATCLVRTDWDLPKHKGLTMFIVPMSVPGVRVSPIRDITGGDEFCEVWLDDVVLTDADVLGEVNGGWAVVRTELRHERANAGTAGRTRMPDEIAEFVERVETTTAAAAEHAGDALIRRLAEEQLIRRIRHGVETNAMPAAATAYVKLFRAWNRQETASAAMQVVGLTSCVWPADSADGDKWASEYLASRARSIAGGSSEMQRNLISERVLGLPPEWQPDRDLPFREYPRNSARAGGS